MLRTLLTTTLLLAAPAAFAQSSNGGGGPGSATQTPASQPSAATEAPASQSIAAPFKLNAPEIGDFKLKAGIKSQNTMGRLSELDNPDGRRYQAKQEYYTGLVHKSGWGAYGQAVTSGPVYGGNGQNLPGAGVLGAGDPSLTILHPDWYRGTSLTLSGQYRAYFPISDRSLDRQQHQQAYYLYTSYRMPKQWSIFNQTTPRYFIQSYYKPSDTTWYVEDFTSLAKQLTTRWAAGVGQWTQVEGHRETKTGVSTDVSLFVRWTPIQNLWIEPRYILPAYVKESVYDAAKTVSLQQSRAELYAQMTL